VVMTLIVCSFVYFMVSIRKLPKGIKEAIVRDSVVVLTPKIPFVFFTNFYSF
jgi:hypothetical protein